MRDNSLSQRTAQGLVTVTINPTFTFTDIKNSISSQCTGCHLPSGPEPDWRVYSNVTSVWLTDSVSSLPVTLNQNTSLSTMLDLWVFAHACNLGGHTGGNRLCGSDLNGASPTTPSQLNTFGQQILHWIEEGARNN